MENMTDVLGFAQIWPRLIQPPFDHCASATPHYIMWSSHFIVLSCSNILMRSFRSDFCCCQGVVSANRHYVYLLQVQRDPKVREVRMVRTDSLDHVDLKVDHQDRKEQ